MVTRSGLTIEQFLTQRETKPASEYARGEVLQKAMPDGPHAAIQTFLAVILYPFLAEHGLGRVFTELRCVFGPPGGERTYVPDLAFVTPGKLPIPRHLYAAPDLAIEILSPGQSSPELVDRVQFYLLYGVQLVWIVDPVTSTLTVQAPGEEGRILHTGDRLDGSDVLPGFSVSVDEIFAQVPK